MAYTFFSSKNLSKIVCLAPEPLKQIKINNIELAF